MSYFIRKEKKFIKKFLKCFPSGPKLKVFKYVKVERGSTLFGNKKGENGRNLKVEDQNYCNEGQNQLYRTSHIPGTK